MPRAAGPALTALTLALAVLLAACSSTPSITIPTQPPAQPTTAGAAPASSPAASAPSPAPATPTTVPPTPRPASGGSPVVLVPGAGAPVAAPDAGGSPVPKPAAVIVPTALPTPSGPSQLVGPVKIVSSLPRNGPAKQQTDSIVTAIKMALDEMGNRVDGAQIVYEDLDDSTPSRNAWDPDQEAENARKAVDDPDVMVYIGPYNASAAMVSIPILNQADLAMVSPSTTYAGLTKPGLGRPNEPETYYPTGRRNFARVVPTDDVQGVVAAGWAKQLGAQKVYVLHDMDLYGRALAGAFAETAQRIGLQVIGGPEGVDPRALDMTGIAAKVRDVGPDLVYVAALADNNAGRLVTELRAALGPNVKLMGPDGLYSQGFLDDAGDAAEGVYVTFGAVAPSRQAGKGAEWYRSYKVRYAAEPEVYAAYAYEVTRVAVEAIRRAGKKDRAAIREALVAIRDYDGILGRWSFDANGDTTLTTISGREVKNGKFDDANAVTLQAP